MYELPALRRPRGQHHRGTDGPAARRERVPRLGGPPGRDPRRASSPTCATRTSPCAGSSPARCARRSSSRALALEPDLVSLLAGLNDMLRRNVDVAAVIGELDGMVARAARRRRRRAPVHAPGPGPDQPAGQDRRGAARAPERRDPRDRGARAARSWSSSTPTRSPPTAGSGTRTACTPTPRATAGSRPPPRTRSACRTPTCPGPTAFPSPLGRRSRRSHAVWFGRYFTPWLIRRLRGRSSGDGRVAKRPELEPFT